MDAKRWENVHWVVNAKNTQRMLSAAEMHEDTQQILSARKCAAEAKRGKRARSSKEIMS